MTSVLSSNSHIQMTTSAATIENTDVIFRVEGNGLVFDSPGVKLSADQEDLNRRIERLEAVLGLTQRQPLLEERYPELAEMGDEIDAEIKKIQESVNSVISKMVGAYKDYADQCVVMEKLKSSNGKT